MFKINRLSYAIITGILLGLPWYEGFSGMFLWIAFIPLLIVEDFYYNQPNSSKREVFLYASLAFLTWNILATWWIAKATVVGACTAITLNTFLFSFIFWLYHVTRKKAGALTGGISLVVYWTAFEYLYLNAEISWPWLNLGNGFANNIKLIQWYEYTGTLGGTAWIMLVNVVLYNIIKSFSSNLNKSVIPAHRIVSIASAVLLIFLPVTLSLIRFNNYKEQFKPHRVAIIQPNIDPYQKFISLSPEQQLDTLLHTGSVSDRNNIDYFLGPETAIQGFNEESELNNNPVIIKIKTFLHSSYTKAKFIVGAETFRQYKPGEPLSGTAHRSVNNGDWIDNYNSALQVDTADTIQIYHKSKLVTGVEKMPFTKHLRFLEKYSINLGGIPGSRGIQHNRTNFYNTDDQILIAPVICYESVYGEYVTGYIQQGADIIFIMTNDGWFGNTPGHRQHLRYACLRAIETRRSTARAANTGISAFINQRGVIISSLGWGQRGCITESINANDQQTFYVRHGDYLGKFACYASVIMLVVLTFKMMRLRLHLTSLFRKKGTNTPMNRTLN